MSIATQSLGIGIVLSRCQFLQSLLWLRQTLRVNDTSALSKASFHRLVGLPSLTRALVQVTVGFGQADQPVDAGLGTEVSFAQGLTPERVSAETVRATLARLGIGWRRAKQWVSSPDPEYARKKTLATG